MCCRIHEANRWPCTILKQLNFMASLIHNILRQTIWSCTKSLTQGVQTSYKLYMGSNTLAAWLYIDLCSNWESNITAPNMYKRIFFIPFCQTGEAKISILIVCILSNPPSHNVGVSDFNLSQTNQSVRNQLEEIPCFQVIAD